MITRDAIYIDGKWVPASGGEKIEVINPATEEIVGTVPVGTEDDVNDAILAARTAFPSWSKSSIEERQGYLNAISAAISERGDQIAAAPAGLQIKRSIYM